MFSKRAEKFNTEIHCSKYVSDQQHKLSMMTVSESNAASRRCLLQSDEKMSSVRDSGVSFSAMVLLIG